MVDKEGGKAVAERFLDQHHGRAVGDARVFNAAIVALRRTGGVVAGQKAVVFGGSGRIHGVGILAHHAAREFLTLTVRGVHVKRVAALRHECLDHVGILLQRGRFGVRIKRAEESGKLHLFIVGKGMCTQARIRAVGGVGVVCAKRSPMVVGAEVEVFVLVRAKCTVSIHAGRVLVRDARIHAVNGCLGIGRVGLLQHAVVVSVCQRHDNGIHLCLAVQPFGRLVDQRGVSFGICLVLIVHFVGGIARDVIACNGLDLDVLTALLRALLATLDRGCTAVELLRAKALERHDGIVCGNQTLAEGVGVGKPGTDLLGIFAREKSGQGKGGKVGQIALFGFRVLGSQEKGKTEQKSQHHDGAEQREHDFIEYVFLFHKILQSRIRSGNTKRDCSCRRSGQAPRE